MKYLAYLFFTLAILCSCGKDDVTVLSTDFQGRFAFISEEQLVVLDSNGSRQLTFDSHIDSTKRDPVWLMQGESILFYESPMCYCQSLEIPRLIHKDGTGLAYLNTNFGFSVGISISPDETHATSSRYLNTLFVFNIDENLQATRIDSITADQIRPIRWSPTSLQFLFVRQNDTSEELAVYNMISKEVTVLIRNAAVSPGITQYDFSYNGGKVAFMLENEVYVVNADGSNAYQLTTDAAEKRILKWSPVTNQIAYTRFVADPQQWTIVRHDVQIPVSESLEAVEDLQGYINQLQWSSDGQEIAFFGDGDKEGVFVVAADGTHLRQIFDKPVEQDFDWYTE